jgi:C-terminal processing protease CtpA/Prc
MMLASRPVARARPQGGRAGASRAVVVAAARRRPLSRGGGAIIVAASAQQQQPPPPSLATRAADLARRAAALAAAAVITLSPASASIAAPVAAPTTPVAAAASAPDDDDPPQAYTRLPASADPAIFDAQRTLAETWQIVGETFFDGQFNGHSDWLRELRTHMQAAFESPDEKSAYARGVDALLAELGDPYTRRVPADEYASFRVSSEGSLQGVGLLLATGTGNSGAPPPPKVLGVGGGGNKARNSTTPQTEALLPRLTVLAPVRGGPAERAGVLPGDEVVAIEGEATDGWTGEQAARVLRGAGGTEVRVRFARAYNPGDGESVPGVPSRSPAALGPASGGRALVAPGGNSSGGPASPRLDSADAGSSSSSSSFSSASDAPTPPQTLAYRTFDVRLKRERVELSPVVSALLRSPAGRLPIGYVRLTSFSQNAAAELRKAMAELDARALGVEGWAFGGGGSGGGAGSSGGGDSAGGGGPSSASSATRLPAQAGGLAGYVLDLRGNGGGLVRAGIEVAAAFLPGAPTVFQVSGRDGEPSSRVVLPPPETDADAAPSAADAARWWSRLRGEDQAASAPELLGRAGAERQAAVAWRETPAAVLPTIDDADDDGASSSSSTSTARRPPPADATTPLVVLVDGGTASASEIVTGALRDNRRAAAIVGDGGHTYGKGRIQSVFELRDGSALFVTVARYRTPKGGEIDQVGIAPDRRCARPGAAFGGVEGGARRGRPLRVRAGGQIIELGDSGDDDAAVEALSALSSSSSSRPPVNPLAVMAGGGAVSQRDEAAAARQIERDGCVLAATRFLEAEASKGGSGGASVAARSSRLAADRLAAARLPPIGVLSLHAEAPPLSSADDKTPAP